MRIVKNRVPHFSHLLREVGFKRRIEAYDFLRRAKKMSVKDI